MKKMGGRGTSRRAKNHQTKEKAKLSKERLMYTSADKDKGRRPESDIKREAEE